MNNKKFIFLIIVVSLLAFSVTFAVVKAQTFLYVIQRINEQQYGAYGFITATNQTVLSTSGVAAYIVVIQPNGDWLQTGTFQGWTGDGQHYYNSPQFYYDYQLGGAYTFHYIGPATIGSTNGFKVFTNRVFHPPWPPPNPANAQWVCQVNYGTSYYINGMLWAWGTPAGVAESHNAQNTLNFHYTNLQYADMGLNWRYFTTKDLQYHLDPPYHYTYVSPTEFYSSGPP